MVWTCRTSDLAGVLGVTGF